MNTEQFLLNSSIQFAIIHAIAGADPVFPVGGMPTLRVGGWQHTILPNFPKENP